MAFPTLCAFKLLAFFHSAHVSLFLKACPTHVPQSYFYPFYTPFLSHVTRSSVTCSGVYPPRSARPLRQGHTSVFDSPAPSLAPRPFIRFTLSSIDFNSLFPKGCEGLHREARNRVEINTKMLGGEEKTGAGWTGAGSPGSCPAALSGLSCQPQPS